MALIPPRTPVQVELTIDDPGAYTETWTTAFNVRFNPGVESFEFICQDGNQAYDLMVGSMGKRMLEITAPHVDLWNGWYDWFDNRPEGIPALSSIVDAAAAVTGDAS